MALWSCPHCGAAQPAASRCWVCHRSSTTCSTCRHFRTSLSPDVGWCALDRRRRPLTGLELRGCWTERPGAPAPEASRPPQRAALDPTWRDAATRTFVPVDSKPDPVALPELGVSFAAVEPVEGWDARVNLFGDAER